MLSPKDNRIWHDDFYVQKDIVVNPPSPERLHCGIMTFALRKADTEATVLVESIEVTPVSHEVRGVFLDGTVWYTFYLTIWKNEKNTEHEIRFSPNYTLPCCEEEQQYGQHVTNAACATPVD